MEYVQATLENAQAAYRQGNLGQADVLCRALLDEGNRNTTVYNLLAEIALSLGQTAIALEYCKHALLLEPGNARSHELMEMGMQAPGKQVSEATDRSPRYLYIKAWGFGFWSDVDHVIGQLLLAELTDRIPVVHWGLNSMFRDAHSRNGFLDYFEPVSSATIPDVINPAFSYYPSKWNYQNLRQPEVNKWTGEGSRLSAITFLNRPENVLVSDYHTYLSDLLPWVSPGHELYGVEPARAYRHLFKKYLHLRPYLVEAIDNFYNSRMRGKKLLAVHVRGSDKITECDNIREIHDQYHSIIDSYLENGLVTHLFLLTDSNPILAEYRQRYGDKLVTTDCMRSDNDTGVHHHRVQERSTLAREIIMDTYLAARCDYFLGIGDSNVSTTIPHLKEWDDNAVTLLGRVHLYVPHTYLYNN